MIKRDEEKGVLRSIVMMGVIVACGHGVSHGAVVISVSETGGVTTVSYSGTLDLSGSVAGPHLGASPNILLADSNSGAFHGNPGQSFSYSWQAVSGSFGTNSNYHAGSGSGGSTFGIRNGASSPGFHLSDTYVSNAPISGSVTFAKPMSELGVGISDSFVGTLASGDTISFVTVPEPSSASIAALGLGLLAFRRNRR